VTASATCPSALTVTARPNRWPRIAAVLSQVLRMLRIYAKASVSSASDLTDDIPLPAGAQPPNLPLLAALF
jgi:hypothetical protein